MTIPVFSGDAKQFAIVYETANPANLRLVDTSDDFDDSHLQWTMTTIGPGQTMETFPCAQFANAPQIMGGIMPRAVALHIGKGNIAVQIPVGGKPGPNYTPPPTPDQIKANQAAMAARRAAKQVAK